MQLIQMTVTVIDFDGLGAEEVANTIAHSRYPNWCITPKVHDTKVHEIGDWTDEHLLNQNSTCEAEYERILKS
jgi:hypothetical protein